MTVSPKALKMTLDSYPRINYLKSNGMKSAGRRALRNPSSSNMRYSSKLYNVEGLDHKVHEPVTVPGMADMQSQDN